MHKCINKSKRMDCFVYFHTPSDTSGKPFLKSIHSKCFLGKSCVYVPGMERLLCGRRTPTSLVPPLVLSYSWTQSAAAAAWRISSFVTLGCHLCYFGIMLFWLHWSAALTGKLRGAPMPFFFPFLVLSLPPPLPESQLVPDKLQKLMKP